MSLLDPGKREEVLLLVHTVEQDKNNIALWKQFLDSISDEDVEHLLNVMNEYKSLIYVFTRNLIDKTDAIKRGDRSKWQKIIDEEVEALKKIDDGFVKV